MNIDALLGIENWPELSEEVREKLREKARSQTTEVYGEMTDEWVANRVRMLMRNDLMHEAICLAARDRIMRLSLEVADLHAKLTAQDKQKSPIPCAYPGCGAVDGDTCSHWSRK